MWEEEKFLGSQLASLPQVRPIWAARPQVLAWCQSPGMEHSDCALPALLFTSASLFASMDLTLYTYARLVLLVT